MLGVAVAQATDDRADVAGGDAEDHQCCVMHDVHQPAVIFVQIRQTALGRGSHIHKIDVGHAVIEHAVDVDRKQHEDAGELQAVYIMPDGQLGLTAQQQGDGEHDDGHMVTKILHRQDPSAIEGRSGGDQQGSQAAQHAAGDHKRQQQLPEFLTLAIDHDGDEDDLDGAQVEGQIRLGQDTAMGGLVGQDIVKHLDKLGSHADPQQDLSQLFQRLLPGKQHACHDCGSAQRQDDQVLRAK